MHTLNSLIVQRLAALGVSRPTPALPSAIEVQLAPHIAALIERRVTKAMVARAFASTLLDAPLGSPEGSGHAPALASSFEAEKPKNGAGATNTEAV
jgi:hypothetical protein